MKKNDSIELVIEDMGTDGEGIGHVATEDGRSIAGRLQTVGHGNSPDV